MSLITIFTPTYNRGYILPKLYDSLCRQTDTDFEWLIIDDGSTDNTRECIESWILENKIKITYFFQNNSGKMKAHNFAINNINTKWFMCIDSDDFIIDTCIEKIKGAISCTESELCSGIVAYRAKDEYENLSGNEFPKCDYTSLKNIYINGYKGETTLVFKSKIIKKYSFPDIEGEKFMTEAYIYDQMDQVYKLYVLPEILTISDYMQDGYTRNIHKVYFDNPVSMMIYYDQAYNFENKFVKKLKIAGNFNCFRIEAKSQKKTYKVTSRFLYVIMYIPGIILRYKRKGMIN